jgi:diguanylate cyclase (GGDEF)-like protein
MSLRPLQRRLSRLGGGRLAMRFVILSLALLLLVQMAGFGVVRHSIERNVNDQIDNQLDTGARVWRRLLETRADRLRQGVEVLAGDFGFKTAVRSGDLPTIDSALENHGQRLGAVVTVLLDTAFEPRAMQSTLPGTLPGALMHDTAAALSADSGGSRLALVGDALLQFVVAPIRTPLITGWVMMGVPVDQGVVIDMKGLSGLEAALLALPDGGLARVVASTLAEDATLQQLAANPDADALPLRDDTLRVRRVALPALGGHVQTVLLRSHAEVAQPLKALQASLALITVSALLLFALGSVWTARRVTAPLRALVAASDGLGRGDYAQPLQGAERRDEIGDLSRAFEHMRLNLRAHDAEMQRLAFIDSLTGLPNRARFRAAVHEALAERARTGRPVAVLMLDLDRFKHVNDVLGYAMGDRLLVAVAERLRSEMARGDGLVARLGGDEFALLLHDDDARTARDVAQRLLAAFERPLQLGDQTVDLGAGIGIARWPQDAGDAETLLVRAEIAMYGAKHGSEPVRLYDPGLDSGSTQTLSLLSELRHAIEAGELRLFLQPKVALDSRRLVGAEALVRWQHPQRGLVPPLEFIPFAEQTGFVRKLTQWVFEEAARQWRVLAAAADDGPPLRLSVNLSTRDLMDAELPDRFEAVLRRHGVPESAFCLEITESAIMDDPKRALGTLEALSARGFKLSIDDFGTGYSSLAYLRRLPVDELKIDRSFVQGMQHNAEDAKIVRSTIDLAHNLGLSVVAEGVEHAADLDMLAGLGCDEGQGYHLSRPLPLAEFQTWAARWQTQPAPVASTPLATPA